ncbi:MAG: carboxypeptidase regulatory-like domain-containing protein, partial [Bacteroidales bacterium]|nr:carboxypeptidase regulatory-like domain-containing protein [Bacteroidales bacterium]
MMVFLLISCAFSLSVSAQTTLITESFENGGAAPAGWTVEQVSGTCPTQFASTTAWPSGFTAYQGTWMAAFRSFSYSTGVSRLKQTTPFSTVGYTNLGVDFAWLESTSYSTSNDRVDVQWSTDGTTWNTAGTFLRYNAVQGWKIKTLTLPAGAQGQATLYIAFQFTSAYGNDCYLDLAHVTGVGPPAPQTVTVGTGTGTVQYPYLTYWHDGRTQLLYKASEIMAAGGSPGEITTLGFDVSSYSSQLMNGFNVRLMNTTATTITGWTTGMTTVYSGTYAVPGTGWQMITLQTPFVWDGSNLLLEVCFDNTSYTSYSYVRYTSVATSTLYYYTDGAAGCAFPNTYASSSRANLRFVVTPWVGTLTGTVTNCFNGAPLAGATVTAGTFSATTNASGVYTMLNVPVGNYSVNCTSAGFLTQTKQATVVNTQTTTVNFCMEPIPAYLSGIVYNNDTGEPIVGAKIMVGPSTIYSVSGGQYTVNIYPVGSFGVTATKAGFQNFTAGPFTFVQNVTTLLDIPMLRATYPPLALTATLNTAATAVDLAWMAPKGMYEIRYDDGICDNWTVWATQGNMNAMKFTPVGYPAVVQGGKVHIGTIDNYPPGANPFVPFQMAIYDAAGPGGMPGAPIGTPVDVTPSNYGWVDFTFPSTSIASGNFYLVMIQGGNAPNAAGICVDETAPQLRSYSYFVPSALWIPASGNFMLRALVYGEGGPLVLDGMPAQGELITATAVPGATYNHTPETVTGYEGQGMFETVEWSSINPSN